MGLSLVETIVIVIMENRSFDHMLGYLSLPQYGRRVDGISLDPNWVSRTTNHYQGVAYAPFHFTGGMRPRDLLAGDPPHERDDIELQLGGPPPWPDGTAPLNGFVASYAANQAVHPGSYCEVMGYYEKDEVPILNFFAENFAVCDRWFASLPTSTWPNRLMAMAGFTRTDNTIGDCIPDQLLVYDWLSDPRRNVSWRVYHEGWPLFTLMPRWRLEILRDAVLNESFRWLDRLAADFASPAPFPQVVFVEPRYTPDKFSPAVPSDDHPRSSIAGGQVFLRRVYEALIANPVRWSKTLLIVTYDENGGFFDHVTPLSVRTDPPSEALYDKPFLTTGMRVPALVISPLVEAGFVFSEPLDHTCILKLLGRKFGQRSYSPQVDGRKQASGEPLAEIEKVLTRKAPRIDRPSPPHYDPGPWAAAPKALAEPTSPFAQAFEKAAQEMRDKHPHEAALKFPHSRDFFLKF